MKTREELEAENRKLLEENNRLLRTENERLRQSTASSRTHTGDDRHCTKCWASKWKDTRGGGIDWIPTCKCDDAEMEHYANERR